MKRFLALSLVLVAGAMTLSSPAIAASGTSDVTLAASASAKIDVLDLTLTLSPSAADYDNEYVEAAGIAGLRVRLKTNSTSGCVLKIKCVDIVPQIALADLLVKTATAAGTGGSTLSAYAAVTGVDQNLWSTTVPQSAWKTVTTDVRVQNLFNYNDAVGGGTTDYTNTLTYTVIAQ
jgi:hypothetical protein